MAVAPLAAERRAAAQSQFPVGRTDRKSFRCGLSASLVDPSFADQQRPGRLNLNSTSNNSRLSESIHGYIGRDVVSSPVPYSIEVI